MICADAFSPRKASEAICLRGILREKNNPAPERRID